MSDEEMDNIAEDEQTEAGPEQAGDNMDLQDLKGSAGQKGDNNDDDGLHSPSDLEAVFDVPVNVSAVLGKSYLQVSQLLKLGPGAVIELDRKVGEAIDIYVNNRLVARGEVVMVDERLGITMTEIIKGDVL